MNLGNDYKLSNRVKLRKNKFWNKELKMSVVCKTGAISNITVGNLISRTTLDKELVHILRYKPYCGRYLASSFKICTILL